MSAAAPLPVAPDTADELRAAGFAGFRTVGMLRDDAGEVPVATGVWVVLREPGLLPRFLERSTGATWRGMDPTEPADQLATRWVARASIVYVGAAPGVGVRHLLQQQVKRFLRFGSGRNVGHWAGRRTWQLANASTLRVAWRVLPADEVRAAADALVAAFATRHGSPPFANDVDEEETA